jgi:hypothetical protein
MSLEKARNSAQIWNRRRNPNDQKMERQFAV